MRLTEAMSSYLAHQALAGLREAGVQARNERLALAAVKKALARAFDQDPRIDEAVRRRIASLSRPIPVGSSEYEILYRQYYEQELRKHRP